MVEKTKELNIERDLWQAADKLRGSMDESDVSESNAQNSRNTYDSYSNC